MERGEPSLVPEWYKPANGCTGLSPHPEERDSVNSFKSRLSAGTRDAPAFGVHEKDSHPYSSFGRNRRDREIESRGRDRVRDRRSQVDDRVYESFTVSSRDRSRRSQSVEPGRQVERAKRPGNGARNGTAFGSGSSVIGGVSRASFERDFPSLGPGIMDRLSAPGIGAVGCLPMGGSSGILAEGWNSALVDMPAPQSPSGTPGLKMAEALVQAPSRVRTPPQLPSGSQVSEELARRQSKLLIPVTPSTPKTLVLGPSERLKSKGTRGDLSIIPKVGQQVSSQLCKHSIHAPLKSGVLKTSQIGNFQVLNRDISGISSTAKEIPAVSRTISLHGANAMSDVPPLKSSLSPKPRSDSLRNTLSSPHRPLGQAQKRNDFFNTLRKKALMNHPTPNCEPSYIGSDKVGEESTASSTSAGPENHVLATDSGFNYSVENGNSVTGECDPCETPERIISGNGVGKSSSDLVVDLEKGKQLADGICTSSDKENQAFATDFSFSNFVENGNGVTGGSDPCEKPKIEENKSCPGLIIDLDKEKQLLQLFGWNEDAKEEALTAEEIESYYKKLGNVNPTLKYSHRVGSGSSGLCSSGCKAEA